MKIQTGYCQCGCGSKTNLYTSNCPKRGIVKGTPARFLAGHYAKTKDYNMENNPHWKGGEYINDAGYVMVYDHGHPRACSNGYVREHIIILEKALGRPLPEKAQCHHYGDVSDNTMLVLCEDQAYHKFLHMRQEAYFESGNASFRKCKFCKEYDSPVNLHITQCPPHGWNIHHQKCETIYERERTVRNGIKRLSGKSHN